MSKIYDERFLHKQIKSFSEEFLLDFISADRKNSSTNHVLMQLIENWKPELHISIDFFFFFFFFAEALLLDLSKTFDYIPDDSQQTNNDVF